MVVLKNEIKLKQSIIKQESEINFIFIQYFDTAFSSTYI